MLMLSSVICLVSLSVFLLVLGVGVKLRVCLGEHIGESGDNFCFLCSGDLCVLCSSALWLSLVDDCSFLCLGFISPVSICSMGVSVSSSDVMSVSLLSSSSEENDFVVKK